ncbi:MAG: tetratricopeptide repeat protein [Nibricoccus sp.]
MNTSPQPARNRNGWFALGLLLAVTLFVYLPVRHHDFVSYDDADYVTDNPRVQAGLSWSGVQWAFTTGHASNWHPLTWLSHMLDSALWGKSATGPHMVNVAFHLANTLLLFIFLRHTTRALWRSLIVVALFVLHPLRVESVAWIAERKDVLSAFFFLLTLLAYSAYARSSNSASHHRTLAYGASLVFFALGLMSKPMLVTLPCVLLLLDFWPLRRVTFADSGDARRKLPGLLREKIPFLFLSLTSCVVTLLAQQRGGAIRSLESFSWSERLGNTAVAYALYLEKTAWPVGLAVFYPHPGHWHFAWIAVSATLVLGLIFLAIRVRQHSSFITVGWLWFLGMLIPTVGLVQVGNQAMADRYTYLPSIGLFIALVWFLAALVVRWRLPREAIAVATASLVLACAFATARQLTHWRDSEHLFLRALAVTERNFVAHNGLGYVLLSRGQPDAAIAQFQRAVEIHPRFADAYTNLGSAFLQKGRDSEALASFQKALEIQPSLGVARYNLGTLLHTQGRAAEAVIELQKAATLLPDDTVTRLNLGNALLSLGRLDEAADAYRDALRIQPDNADAQNNLGYVLLQTGRIDQAVSQFQRAVALQSTHANAYYNLGDAQRRLGHLVEASAAFEKVLTLQPGDIEAKTTLETIRQELAQSTGVNTPSTSAVDITPR